MPGLDPGIHDFTAPKQSEVCPSLNHGIGDASAVSLLLGGVGSSKNRKQSSDAIRGDL
jgi:hypothetical protein